MKRGIQPESGSHGNQGDLMKSCKFSKNMKIIVVVLLFLSMMSVDVVLADSVLDVSRQVSGEFEKGELTGVKLVIEGEAPLFVGIVETIPEGFSFPEVNEDISSASNFKVDKDQGKISFSVTDERELIYYVIPSSSGEASFEGYWVDMLYQTPELNEGKERWNFVNDPHSKQTGDLSSEVSSQSQSQSTPGFGAVSFFISVGLLFISLRANTVGEDK